MVISILLSWKQRLKQEIMQLCHHHHCLCRHHNHNFLFYNSSRCSQGSYNAWRAWNTQFWKISFHSRRLRSSSKPQKRTSCYYLALTHSVREKCSPKCGASFLRNALTWLVCDSERAWPVFLLRYYSLLEKPYLLKKSDVYIVCFILMHVFLSLSHCIRK